MLQLNVVRDSAGELLESVAGVLKGSLDLGQLDVSIEVVTDVAHATEDLHGSIKNELDDVDGGANELLAPRVWSRPRRREVW
jgi:hypothetical protein